MYFRSLSVSGNMQCNTIVKADMSACTPRLTHTLFFTKYPLAGFAKTRLIPAYGAEEAAKISEQLSIRTLSTLRKHKQSVSNRHEIKIHYAHAGGCATDEMHAWLKPEAGESVHMQSEGSLGERLEAAFRQSFKEGATAVVVVGSDAPELSVECMARAFDGLGECGMVIGPAEDGGYYLLGLRRMCGELFRGVKWSSSEVFDSTLERGRQMGLTWVTLETLRDVDEAEDVAYFRSVQARETGVGEREGVGRGGRGTGGRGTEVIEKEN